MDLEARLKEKLLEMFRVEDSDLDFGIYRLMNYKRREVEEFINEKLIPMIDEEIKRVVGERNIELNQELEDLMKRSSVKKYIRTYKQIKEMNLSEKEAEDLLRILSDDEDVKRYFELKKLVDRGVTTEEVEGIKRSIYNHLINFFSRYYINGDFIPRQKIGKGAEYYIPYHGEDVYFHWATKDQYYIKTVDYHRVYVFKVEKEDAIVEFRVRHAEEEKNNNKSRKAKMLRLDFDGEESVFTYDEKDRKLTIYFRYVEKNDDNIVKEEWKKLSELLIKQSGSIPFVRDILGEEEEDSILLKHMKRFAKKHKEDFFIHKDLKGFLQRELDMYVKNKIMGVDIANLIMLDGNEKLLQKFLVEGAVFSKVAMTIIDFLAQIEDFQKLLWNKKKFVYGTHYVITLDRIWNRGKRGREIVYEIVGMLKEQKDKFIEEVKAIGELEKKIRNRFEKALKIGYKSLLTDWYVLGIIDESFDPDEIISDGLDKKLNPKWQYLPVDTAYIPTELEEKIISLFDNLDDALDGWLIHSENYQALNTILPKWREKVQTVYIDPPFNLERNADFLYRVDYKDSTWITMLENRIRLARDLINEKGSMFVRCDYNGNMYVRLLMNEIFGEENFRNEIVVSRISKQDPNVKKYNVQTDTIFWFVKTPSYKFSILFSGKRTKAKWHAMDSQGQGKPKYIFGVLLDPPPGRHWTYSQSNIKELEMSGRLRLICRKCGYTHKSGIWRGCPKCGNKTDVRVEYLVLPKNGKQINSNWTDIPGYSQTTGFSTENSEILLKRVIESTSDVGDVVLDFFLGSGTATAVAHKIRRRWIGVEVGDHFYTVNLPRMKKVLFYDKSGISKENDVKEYYNAKNAGGFFKYFSLEQYEDTIHNIEFTDTTDIVRKFDDYVVKYMLEYDTRNSKILLGVDKIDDPFNFKMKIFEGYREKLINVDLVETFNIIMGIDVLSIETKRDSSGRKYVFVIGKKDGEYVLVVWRSIADFKEEDYRKDSEFIDEYISSFENREEGREISHVYANGQAVHEKFKPIIVALKEQMFALGEEII